MHKTKRRDLYARVSTLDKGQDSEMQLVQLRQFTQAQNFEIVTEYIDYISRMSKDGRQYKLMMDAAKKRKIDVVLVGGYHRFTCFNRAVVKALKEFQSLGIDFISYQESIDTTSQRVSGYFMRWHLITV